MDNPIRWMEGTLALLEFKLRRNGHNRLAHILGWHARRKAELARKERDEVMAHSFPTRHVKQYKHNTRDLTLWAALLTEDNASEISNWVGGAQIVEEEHALDHSVQEGLNIKTPEGVRRASVGQYVIKIGDSVYVVSPRIFVANYTEI